VNRSVSLRLRTRADVRRNSRKSGQLIAFAAALCRKQCIHGHLLGVGDGQDSTLPPPSSTDFLKNKNIYVNIPNLNTKNLNHVHIRYCVPCKPIRKNILKLLTCKFVYKCSAPPHSTPLEGSSGVAHNRVCNLSKSSKVGVDR
jgi:hypothetical protein